MDPTETLIEYLSALERLEELYFTGEAVVDGKETEEAQAARADAIQHGANLGEWLEELGGAPPHVSEVVLTKRDWKWDQAVGG